MWYYNVSTKKESKQILVKVRKITARALMAASFRIVWTTLLIPQQCISKLSEVTSVCSCLTLFYWTLSSNPFIESFVSFPHPLLKFSQWFQTLDRRTLNLFIGLYLHWNYKAGLNPEMQHRENCPEWRSKCPNQKLEQGIN